MTYEEALQIAIEELDEKIQCLSDTFNGHSARIESYIYDLAMARKALIKALEEAEKKLKELNTPEVTPEVTGEVEREWVGLTTTEIGDIMTKSPGSPYHTAIGVEAKLKEKNT